MKNLIVAVATLAAATAGGLGLLDPAKATTGRHVGVVTASPGLVAHGTPSTHSIRTGRFAHGARIELNCKVHATTVDGNSLWYLIVDHDSTQWVSARYVRNVGSAPDFCDPSDGSFAGRATARVNQRAGASTGDRIVGRFERGDTVRAVCYTLASPDDRWIYTARGRWVYGGFVRVSTRLRYCLNR